LISANPTSISSLAASMCAQNITDLEQAQIVVLGAGEMAELAVEALRKRGAARLVVVNRTLERAQALAQRWGAQAATFEDVQHLLANADILIASTGAPHTLINYTMVSQAMQSRPGRPLVLVDIAVPRDIDPEVAQIERVHLFDIDHLNVQLEQSLGERSREAPAVQKVVAEEEALFCKYLETLDMLPLIVELRQQAEAIRQVELDKTLRRLPDLTSAERVRIEALTHALVKKLLAQPTQRLRAEAARPHAPEYAALTRTLFGLTAEHGRAGSPGEHNPALADTRQSPAPPSFFD
jgi:glutamyl-tRNA reductase